MAKKGHRQIIKFKNSATGSFYTTYKNKLNTKDKLTIKKFDPVTGKHEEFVETKI
jgi:large subunit ribosomal protein L33